jgi:hypothetical protein
MQKRLRAPEANLPQGQPTVLMMSLACRSAMPPWCEERERWFEAWDQYTQVSPLFGRTRGTLAGSGVPAAATVFNGFGKTIGLVQIGEPGLVETPILLTNTLNVGKVAFLVEQNPEIGVPMGTVNPVVCECNDGFLNDIGGRHVPAQDVRAALANASGAPFLDRLTSDQGGYTRSGRWYWRMLDGVTISSSAVYLWDVCLKSCATNGKRK